MKARCRRSTITSPPTLAASRWSSPATSMARCKALVNACAHRGAMLCRRKQGNKGSIHLPLPRLDVQQRRQAAQGKGPAKTGAYPDSFNCDGSHDLKRLARFENYRGFLFGSLKADVVPLVSDYLGETRRRSSTRSSTRLLEAWKCCAAASSYVYDGNWKLQIENGADGYHVSSVHWNYSATMGRRNVRSRRHAHRRRQWLVEKPGRRLRLRPRAHPAVDPPAQPRSAPGARSPRGLGRTSGPGARRLYRRPDRATSACTPMCT